MRIWLSIFIFSLFAVFTYSQTKKVTGLKNKREQLLNEIKQVEIDISNLKKTTANILNLIGLKKDIIDKRKRSLALLEQEINEITQEQLKIEQDIPVLETELKKQQQGYNKAVEGMVKRRMYQSKLLFVLSGRSLGESFRRFMYLKDYSKWRNKQIDEIRVQKEELNAKKALLEKTKKEKMSLLATRESEQKKLQSEEVSLNSELAEANGKQKELQGVVAKKQQQARELNSQIEKLIAEEIARQEREAKRQAEAEAKRKKEEERKNTAKNTSKTKSKDRSATTKKSGTTKNREIKTTKENQILSNNFEANKGRLAVPVTGSYRIVGEYGEHTVGGITTANLGIVIRANAGAEAKCVFPGEVNAIVFVPGAPVSILVSHGTYFTLYTDIQSAYVTKGQKVAAGQLIGKIYTDTETGYAIMKFQVWKGGTKMNPRPWLNL
ncbi:murein hydrolase activator EnvC [Dysgonomonas sp. 520]|uniref:murein hydrolase activator EnvC family protein n=1 Tax=Dysgonomonas sp. 520 TaxID=2302931 RepID=UPI0013D40D3A|nr:peptidoglycan DD-metalloendopeptidase family protein [Dysgonomonas sp. 520]NDW10429.1 hypothetical protein [Dysgonomonas sp. 520]